ncbi:MAG: MGMT family protein [Clostridia bacterium]|nr:MGMT family protein [Clostridia bacterium]
MSAVFEKIYEVVMKIPEGRVATYGQVARLAGNERWARVVGYALHNNPLEGIIPCHRVVNRQGRTADTYAFGGGDVQRKLLEAEGIVFDADGSIDLEKYGFQP